MEANWVASADPSWRAGGPSVRPMWPPCGPSADRREPDDHAVRRGDPPICTSAATQGRRHRAHGRPDLLQPGAGRPRLRPRRPDLPPHHPDHRPDVPVDHDRPAPPRWSSTRSSGMRAFALAWTPATPERGQVIALFVLGLTVVVFAVGLVIDGGRASRSAAHRRTHRISPHWPGRASSPSDRWRHENGTDANVRPPSRWSSPTTGASPVTFGSPNGPRYVAGNGAALTSSATGRSPPSRRRRRPVAVQPSVDGRTSSAVFGVSGWTAGATATAKGGYSSGGPSPAPCSPRVSQRRSSTPTYCSGTSARTPRIPCYPQHLTPGTSTCRVASAGSSSAARATASAGSAGQHRRLRQLEAIPAGRDRAAVARATAAAPQVGLPGSADKIGSLPGNKVSADCDYYIDNGSP